MPNLTNSFRLLEITRSQPQYGYALAGISKGELSDLAQHHYLVTIFAWLLAREICQRGGSLDMQKILEICITHDLGELFGGDIAMPYVRANPIAKKKAVEFERENHRFIASFMEKDSAYLDNLFAESMTPATDEALVAKLADYLEVTHYKLYMNKYTPGDLTMARKSLNKIIAKMSNSKNKRAVTEILKEWEGMMTNPSSELFEEYKQLDA